MRARDRTTMSLYRTTLAAIANAEATPLDDRARAGAAEQSPAGAGATDVERRELDEDAVEAVVRREAEERRDASRSTAGPEATRVRLAREADLLEALLEDRTAAGPT